MGGGMSLIVPGLYVGGLFSAKSQVQLDANNITHLCSVLRQRFEAPNRKQIVLEVDDSPTEDLSKHFENACFFIHDARASGGHVLVHCACGVSRSVTVALAYLLVTTDFPLNMLIKAMRGARHCACPNYGFMQQLLEFEKSENRTSLREKLLDKHGEWPPEKKHADSEALQAAVAAQDYFLLHKVYPNEAPLNDTAASDRTVSVQEENVIAIDPSTSVRHLGSSFYTVYPEGQLLRFSEFLSSDSSSSPDTSPDDESNSSSH